MSAAEWRKFAACLGEDPTLWDAPGKPRAFVVCRSCPVLAECRAWADASEGARQATRYSGVVIACEDPAQRDLRRGLRTRDAMPAACSQCGALLRGVHETATEKPGTVRYASQGLCRRCYDKAPSRAAQRRESRRVRQAMRKAS